ncbi:MAG: leucine--tRNA ligase [Chitinivibrionales bacterium]|nr:leucine--tRNA ligase [Chitinivibrionales bacterium]
MAPSSYDPATVEPKWQQRWEQEGVFRAVDDTTKPKYYVLIEFPYPSGEGLHVGHPRSYTALDVVARKRRMEGHNVLYPIGWDAFGLPTENFAIKTGLHPTVVTERNVNRYRAQLQRLGFSFDWSREVNTTDPSYYKWTQWIFLKLWENGLAYKDEIPINWCNSCNIGLANEEVVGGVCERCGGEVVRKVKSQWMLRITKYAERLLADLDTVEYLDKIKIQQANWIGRSTGAEVDFPVKAPDGEQRTMRVFTTRPDTLFGVTYMVLSPEHPLVAELLPQCENTDEVRAYVDAAARKSDFERTEVVKEVSGVELKGIAAVNPATKTTVPVWIADYVLVSYGTGAIMAVPGHDERDWRFARKFDLPIVEVISGGDVTREAFTDIESGTLVNSGPLDGMPPSEAIRKMTEIVEEQGYGQASVQYRLRDWVFSRQHYWGEPIPMVHCQSCGWVPLPESELPLVLPSVERYKPTETGESPLAEITDWVNTSCPKCKGAAQRETDTMPTWAGSSWYFLRYTDPHNDTALADPEKLKYWTPVDWYNGGMEHTTLHLLYSRFWHKFLYDIGVVPTAEPYRKRTSHGLVLGENGEKMSKSRGNVVNPDEMVDKYGADSFRLYEMFMGAFDQPIPWSTQGLNGMNRFLHRVWEMREKVAADAPANDDVTTLLHQTIKKVGDDIEATKFNTAVAQLMTLSNALNKLERIPSADFECFLVLLAPFAPHIAEELWAGLGKNGCIAGAAWPLYDEDKLTVDRVTVVVQVNGKLRAEFEATRDASRDELERTALELDRIKAHTDGKAVRKVIVVPNKLVNIVVA